MDCMYIVTLNDQLHFIISLTSYENIISLVLGDSLLNYVPRYLDSKKFKVECFPGINVNRLISKLRNRSFLQCYQDIILHVGTNNIGYQLPAKIVSSYMDLISVIRYWNKR